MSDVLIVFTDGSCIHNGEPDAKSSSSTVWPNGEFDPSCFYMLPGSKRSNNRAEFFAALMAFKQANAIDPGKKRPLRIYTDSMLLVNTCTTWMHSWVKKNWKKNSPGEIKNLDLVKQLYECYSKRDTIFKHVKAHTKSNSYESIWNKKADEVAYAGVHEDELSSVLFQ